MLQYPCQQAYTYRLQVVTFDVPLTRGSSLNVMFDLHSVYSSVLHPTLKAAERPHLLTVARTVFQVPLRVRFELLHLVFDTCRPCPA